MLLAFGTLPQSAPQILGQKTVAMLGAVVPINRFIIAGIVVVATGALVAAYRWTSFGLATRAASENETSGMLRGLSPKRLALSNSVIAALLAGVVGILASTLTELDTSTLPLQIVPALAAAVLAGMSSPSIACLAGFGIGVMYSLVGYASGQSWFPTSGGAPLPGVTDMLAFLFVVLAMFARGAKLPGRGQLIERGLPEVPRPRYLLEIALPVAAIAAVALVVLPYDFRQAEVNTIIGTVLALSLVVITGFVGQVSVVQLSLAGVTGFVISRLAHDHGVPFPIAPIAGIAAAVVIGLLTAVSALRVRGVSLVIVTLAAAVAIDSFYFNNTDWGAASNGSPVPEPHLFGLDIGTNAGFRGLDGNIPSPVFGFFALGTVVLLCLMVGYLRRGGFGRRMLAVRSNERASAAAAINPRNVKLIAFGVSAMIAGCAGSLYAYNFGSVSPDRFDAFTALSLIAFAYAGGITLISGRRVRRVHLDPGAVPVCARQVVRAQRQLVLAVRRRDPDRHAAAEPRGRRGGVLQAAAPQASHRPARGGRAHRTASRAAHSRRGRRAICARPRRRCWSPTVSRSTSVACTRCATSASRSAKASSSA